MIMINRTVNNSFMKTFTSLSFKKKIKIISNEPLLLHPQSSTILHSTASLVLPITFFDKQFNENRNSQLRIEFGCEHQISLDHLFTLNTIYL
uniref:CSON005118 protein n=1 Tax=Culicoides sonorensis TaxID=179676 RepID=A0A336MQN2_CULSO